MSVTVSLVTHRSRDRLPACLAGIRAQGERVAQVRVVDNASDDGTVEWLRECHPEVRVEALGRNAGYAEGHNRNYARASQSGRATWRAFLALNPDVALAADYLERGLAALEREPAVGAVTGRLLAPGRARRLDSAGIIRTAGRTRFVDRGRGAPASRFEREEPVFGACGAAALYRRRALEQVSRPGEAPFAERLFMYYEDVDLAWRLRRGGWHTLYVPDAECTHERGGSGAAPSFVEYHLVRNRLWVSLRNASARELLAELPGLALFEGVKGLQALGRPHLRAALRDQLGGVAASLRERRMGEGLIVCGIAGAVVRGRLESTVLGRMGRELLHRGPDDAGELLLEPFRDAGGEWQVGLVHRRLAVFDPRPAGAQPMTSRSGRTTIVLNGEIYDHPELRALLPGFPWRTRTDTEVLLELLEARGLDVLQRVNGMFAFALWDAKRRCLLVARDRLGIKPLFVRAAREALVFASELSSVAAGPDFERRIDSEALSAYLDLGFVPAPRSLLSGVSKLPPGTGLEWREGRVRLRRWWRLPPPPPEPATDSGWRDELRGALADAVRIRLRSDVPVGAFLSGGLDSTLITALAARERSDFRTFSVCFPESPALDESRYARAAAQELGTRHTELAVRGEDVARAAPQILARIDEPLADASLVPVHLLSARARADVTVALSGDGSDELFAGYRRYRVGHWLGRWNRLPAGARRRAARWLERRAEDRGTRWGDVVRRARKVVSADGLAPAERALAMARLFSEEEKARLLPAAHRARPDLSLELLRAHRTHAAGRDELDTWLRVDLRLGLPDDMLTKVDRGSMAHGLEVRVPFLDHRVVACAAALPSAWKLRGPEPKPWTGVAWAPGPKPLLRAVFGHEIPAFVQRRPKAGFDAPVGSWLRGPLRPMARDLLAPEILDREGLLDPKTVSGMLDSHDRGEADHAWRLWGLVVLCDWARRQRVV